MDESKFKSILPIITTALVKKIAVAYELNEDAAIEKLYTTKLYSCLENEKTKVWHYSVEKIFDLFQQEVTSGCLELPEY